MQTLTLASGTFTLQSGGTLTMSANGTIIRSGGSLATSGGSLTLTNAYNVNYTTVTATAGPELSGSGLQNTTINVNAGNHVALSSNTTLTGTLTLTSGLLQLGSYNLIVGSTSGGSTTSYVVNGTSSTLGMNLTAGAGAALFPVGTSSNYAPASIQLNSGSSSGMITVRTMNNVYRSGFTGTDLSLTQPCVDNTWDISTSIVSGLNLNLQLFWTSGMQVNGFHPNTSRISHYTGTSWDTTSVSAAISAGGLLSSQRNNITSLSPFAVFDKNAVTAVNELNNDLHFNLYPNPTNGQFTVVLPTTNNQEPTTIIITDLLGQEIIKRNTTEKIVNLNINETGIYLIYISTEKGTATQKLIISQ